MVFEKISIWTNLAKEKTIWSKCLTKNTEKYGLFHGLIDIISSKLVQDGIFKFHWWINCRKRRRNYKELLAKCKQKIPRIQKITRISRLNIQNTRFDEVTNHNIWVSELSLNNVKTAGSQYLCGFPFFVLAKCLQFLDIIK